MAGRKGTGCKWAGIVMQYCDDVPAGSLSLSLFFPRREGGLRHS